MKSPFHAILALVGGAVAQESVEMPALPVGEPIRGELSSELPVEATEHLRSINLTTATACSQVYRTRVESSGRYRFSMDASAFDPYLILRDADGRLLADDDDGGLGLQARLEVDLEADRLYVLEACSLWCQPGAFELEFHPVSANVEEDSSLNGPSPFMRTWRSRERVSNSLRSPRHSTGLGFLNGAPRTTPLRVPVSRRL